jgi:starch phosphorylase
MCGQHRWAGGGECDEAQIQKAPAARLWQLRNQERATLIEYARERLAGILAASGSALDKVEAARHLFDPNILTLGFARRFATYKRPNLLLRDRERLLRLLSNPERPVQLIIAGKAHPQDKPGQELIREWVQFIREPEVRPHIMFLSDYDMLLTENLVHGVDLWINNPRRPWEACGTSGMKVLVNGGLNLSELDGWWAEAYTPEVGWALGDGKEHEDDPTWDAAEADALYTLLESEVVPEFYTRDANGVPMRWIQRMRASMAQLTPRFSASRAVIEYTEQHYVPAAAAYRERAANRGAIGAEMAEWQRNVEREWGELRFGKLRVSTTAALHHFDVEVFLNSLDPNAARVELYAEAHNGTGSVQAQMSFDRDLGGGWRLYRASVPATRPAEEFTARLIPQFSGAANPFDSAKILWQR